MSRSSTAEQLVRVLRPAGVERVYGVVGDSLNPFVDAIRTTEGIAWVHVRNEEAGAFAAAAEAQLTGRLAVCAGSCGPGNAHLVQGLYDAHRSGAPVLAIGQAAQPNRAHAIRQGVDPVRQPLRRGGRWGWSSSRCSSTASPTSGPTTRPSTTPRSPGPPGSTPSGSSSPRTSGPPSTRR